MKFKKEFLQDMVWDDAEGVEVIERELVDTSRWSIIYECVFKFEGKFYQTSYSIGATESQDETPYEYEPDEIECSEVEPVIVEKTEWKVIK